MLSYAFTGSPLSSGIVRYFSPLSLSTASFTVSTGVSPMYIRVSVPVQASPSEYVYFTVTFFSHESSESDIP